MHYLNHKNKRKNTQAKNKHPRDVVCLMQEQELTGSSAHRHPGASPTVLAEHSQQIAALLYICVYISQATAVAVLKLCRNLRAQQCWPTGLQPALLLARCNAIMGEKAPR